MFDDQEYAVHPDLAGPKPIINPTQTAHGLSSTPVEQVQEVVEEVQEQVYEQPQQREDTSNFRSLRDKADRERERADRERERADRLEARLYATSTQNNQAVSEPERDEYVSDDFITGKEMSKAERKRQADTQAMREDLARTKRELQDTMLSLKYPDLNQVITDENVRAFAQADPDGAHSLSLIPDQQAQKIAVYKAIKKAGVAPVEDNYVKDRARVQTNSVKPKTSNSIAPQQGESPLARANVFANMEDTEAANLKIYEETMRYASHRE